METMIAGFEKTIRDLEGWIEAERSQPGARYVSTLTDSLTQRRDTLQHSIEDLKRKLAETPLVFSLGAASTGLIAILQ
jgi:hypothetical protein